MNDDNPSYRIVQTVRCRQLWTGDGARFKVYELSLRDSMRPELVSAARETFRGFREKTAENALGWITIHDESAVCYFFANWWTDRRLVRQRGWVAYGHGTPKFEPITEGVVSGVAEISIASFERDQWAHSMLTGTPDAEEYLCTTFPAHLSASRDSNPFNDRR
jgi:hypothetical protein